MENLKEIKNAIVDEMATVLYDRGYDYYSDYLRKIVSECLIQKNNLIELFSKHPNWNSEKLMIQFDTDIERKIDYGAIRRFANWLYNVAHIEFKYFLRYQEQSREYQIYNFIYNIEKQFFDTSMENEINEMNQLNPNFKLRTNMKTSKAIGKICREEGWDKLEGYNQQYAILCDAISPLKIRRHTCISLNPIDFLLMSNGNSWSSCHYIGDDDDEAGCYSSGTISYMLDEHSFLFYTVDASYNGSDIELEPKIQRQVFGYNDEVLAQLRLYPQSNDSGAEQVYTDIREIVQKVVADCLGKPNLWIRSKDAEEVCKKGSGATCFADWRSCNPGGEHCSISTHKEREKGKEGRRIIFGAQPICIECGERHSYANNISCCNNCEYCEICGDRIHRDNVCWGGRYGDIPYCSDCSTWCDVCETYHPNDCVQEIDGRYVCDDCLEEHYDTCKRCGSLHDIDDMYYDRETGEYYCEECYDKLIEERRSKEKENDEVKTIDYKYSISIWDDIFEDIDCDDLAF